MANGDIAAGAGIPPVPATKDKRLGYDDINRALDQIVLGDRAQADAIRSIAKGGTGATTAAGARSALGAAAIDHTHQALFGPGGAGFSWNVDQWYSNRPLGIDSRLAVSQELINPYARNNPVVTSWVALAVDSGGRIGIQPSARRFKKNVRTLTYTAERLRAFLALLDRVFQIKAVFANGDTNTPDQIGWIAEEAIDAGFAELVVFDEDGQPLSINYAMAVIPLHAVARQQQADLDELRQTVAELAATIDTLTERKDA